MFELLTDQKETLMAVPQKVKIGVPKKQTKSLKNTCKEGHFLGKLRLKAGCFKKFTKIINYLHLYFKNLGTVILKQYLSTAAFDKMKCLPVLVDETPS